MSNNYRFLQALKRQPVDKTPVWIMRQAGRYLPEYRKIRAKVNHFLALCQNPELASQVTLQPIERYPLDSAIVFSDILIIPYAMGMKLSYEAGEGPKFADPIRSQRDLEALIMPDPEQDMGYTQETIRLTKQALAGKCPLIGFAGSPWTVATYMIEGGGSKTFSVIKAMLYQQPILLAAILQKITDATILSLQAQIQAGADVAMVFDTWGSVLTSSAYQQFSLQYMTQIVKALKDNPQTHDVPVILFTKQGHQWLEAQAQSGCDALGLDWTIDIDNARARVGDQVALQGNCDPCVLYGKPDKIQTEVKRILDSFGPHCGHIFNLGHGIYPDIDPEHVHVLIETVHAHSSKIHQQAHHRLPA